MKYFVITSLLISVAVAGPVSHSSPASFLEVAGGTGSRIISGEPAVLGQFPWQASLRLMSNWGTTFCGGSLISDRWILTAGHCGTGASSAIVGLGSIHHDGSEASQVTLVSYDIFVHNDYDPEWLWNDICVILLPQRVTFNDYIKPVRLPRWYDVSVGAGENVTVSGWGKTSDASNDVSKTLNYVELTTISNDECKNTYGATITAGSICAKGHPEHSSCNGDSGGPLVQYDSYDQATHVGIVSFVHKTGCDSGNPSGYVRTQSYLNWISNNTGIYF